MHVATACRIVGQLWIWGGGGSQQIDRSKMVLYFAITGPLFRPRFETDREDTHALQSSCSCMGSVRVQPDLEIGCVAQRTRTFFTG